MNVLKEDNQHRTSLYVCKIMVFETWNSNPVVFNTISLYTDVVLFFFSKTSASADGARERKIKNNTILKQLFMCENSLFDEIHIKSYDSLS